MVRASNRHHGGGQAIDFMVGTGNRLHGESRQ